MVLAGGGGMRHAGAASFRVGEELIRLVAVTQSRTTGSARKNQKREGHGRGASETPRPTAPERERERKRESHRGGGGRMVGVHLKISDPTRSCL